MSDERFDERGEVPTIEVRVHHHGALVQQVRDLRLYPCHGGEPILEPGA